MKDEDILELALERFAISTLYGQSQHQLMPISDAESLIEFARCIEQRQAVEIEALRKQIYTAPTLPLTPFPISACPRCGFKTPYKNEDEEFEAVLKDNAMKALEIDGLKERVAELEEYNAGRTDEMIAMTRQLAACEKERDDLKERLAANEYWVERRPISDLRKQLAAVEKERDELHEALELLWCSTERSEWGDVAAKNFDRLMKGEK